MDESQSLEALSDIISAIADRPKDFGLHAQHIRLARSIEGMQQEAVSAAEMMTQFLAASDDVWSFLIDEKQKSVDLASETGVNELLQLYQHAEEDYLSMPILQKHLQFILDNYEKYHGENPKIMPEALGDCFSVKWTRQAMEEVVNKGIGHLTQSHLLWDPWRDWEMERLQSSSGSEKSDLIEHVQDLHLKRLQQPHSNSDETFQSYSSFTTNFRPPQQYESLLVAASKLRAQGVKAYDRRERNEAALTQASYSLEAYAKYIASERRMKYLDLFVVKTLFERAIAEAAKRRYNGESGAEDALAAFWVGYLDCLRIANAGADVELESYQRAVRNVPGSGEMWARYIRFMERTSDIENDALEGRDSVADIYSTALSFNLLQSDVDQIVPLVLARAGYEKRQIEAGNGGEDGLPTLIGVLESGIEMVHNASKTGDVKLRLEKYLSEIYQQSGLIDNALEVWQTATKKYKTSYLVWTLYTDALIKNERFDDARAVFVDIHLKRIDWPEAVWENWITFEHLHGSVDDISSCLDKVEKAQQHLNANRAKEAEKAAYDAMQIAAEVQPNYPAAAASAPEVSSATETPMDVDASGPPVERGTKRAAEDEPSPDVHKKAKIAAPLKRDRENCTVFVADLPNDTAEDELKTLFKDCGQVRDVKITQLSDELVATVEFFDRDSIPGALTKDKKRIRDTEVAVHLAWKSTLYVTNFPESADDASMRELFGQYGTIFDIRWPSKKFKNTRRFCYVQFTSPTSAEKALELHGRELGPNLLLNVFISNPERKKERTDQDANEKEVYVAGLSRFTNKEDLEKLFSTYGKLKEVRIALDDSGRARGYAFVEFEDDKDAQKALSANNHQLKNRTIAVTLADPRVRARHRSEIGLSRIAEIKSRSVRIRNLPPATQEGLLQQALEKVAAVKRLEVFMEKLEAVLELESPAEAGKLLLRADPIEFNGNVLEFSEEGRDGAYTRTTAPPLKTGGMFIPRSAASRPRAGLGNTRAAITRGTAGSDQQSSSSQQETSAVKGKGQDDFRKMLGGK